jgi:hypothetical protein
MYEQRISIYLLLSFLYIYMYEIVYGQMCSGATIRFPFAKQKIYHFFLKQKKEQIEKKFRSGKIHICVCVVNSFSFGICTLLFNVSI